MSLVARCIAALETETEPQLYSSCFESMYAMMESGNGDLGALWEKVYDHVGPDLRKAKTPKEFETLLEEWITSPRTLPETAWKVVQVLLQISAGLLVVAGGLGAIGNLAMLVPAAFLALLGAPGMVITTVVGLIINVVTMWVSTTFTRWALGKGGIKRQRLEYVYKQIEDMRSHTSDPQLLKKLDECIAICYRIDHLTKK